MAQPTLHIVGSINMDLIVHVSALPNPGDTVLGDALVQLPGGKAANQAVAAARAGAAVRFGGCVGTDSFAGALVDEFASEGIGGNWISVVDGPSGVAMITIDQSGENQIVVAPGANGALDAVAAERLVADGFLDYASIVLAPCETPVGGLESIFRAAKACGAVTMFNAAPAVGLPPSFLDVVDVLIANEGEIEALAVSAGEAGAGVGAAAIAMAASVPIVVVTVGAAGAIVTDRNGQRSVQSVRVDPVDTVGAGDAFCGNLAAQWLQSPSLDGCSTDTVDPDDLDAAVFRANAAGALTTLRAGARTSPTVAELDAFLAKLPSPL